MLIAVPSEAPGGIDAPISEHFGHCAAFTIVEVQDGEIAEVSVVENLDHQEGGCMGPVLLLKGHGVEVLIAGGMGMRPLSGFQQVGIAVHFKEDATAVREAIELFVAGRCRAFGEAETCGGGDSGCGSHHAADVSREPIVGLADVRDGRIITLGYEIRDREGSLLDTSQHNGPMRYLHGAGHIFPAIETAVTGLERGARVSIEIPPSEGFGERDDSRIVDVPRQQLPPDVSVGAMVTGQNEVGNRFSLVVVSLDDEVARLDGNHPLAGKELVFDITVLDVQSATPAELAHGHVH